jgi:transformer-2 protein
VSLLINRDRSDVREDALNPGNNLYVTGLSTRVTEKELDEHFSQEGKVFALFIFASFQLFIMFIESLFGFILRLSLTRVCIVIFMLLMPFIFQVIECRLVVDPRTQESRGFGFVTMDNAEDADSCVKYLNRSTLEGRIITVEKVSTFVMDSNLESMSSHPIESRRVRSPAI